MTIRETFRQGPVRLALVMSGYLVVAAAVGQAGVAGIVLNGVLGGLIGLKSRKLLRWINEWDQANQRDAVVRFLSWQALLDAHMTLQRELLPYRPNETETLN